MNLTINSNNKEQAEFLAFLGKIKEVIDKTEGKSVEVEMNGQKMTVSKTTLGFLTSIYQSIRGGKSVTIAEEGAELTTQEAANMLNVSRPYLIKLLDKGELPHRKVGKHRRVPQKAVEEYRIHMRVEQEKALDFLAKQAQELNMGY